MELAKRGPAIIVGCDHEPRFAAHGEDVRPRGYFTSRPECATS